MLVLRLFQPLQINGGNQLIASEDLESLQVVAKSREQKIVTLEADLAKCREELLARRMEVNIVENMMLIVTANH